MRGQRATGNIQRNNYHHRSCGPSLIGKTMSLFLIFTQRRSASENCIVGNTHCIVFSS